MQSLPLRVPGSMVMIFESSIPRIYAHPTPHANLPQGQPGIVDVIAWVRMVPVDEGGAPPARSPRNWRRA